MKFDIFEICRFASLCSSYTTTMEMFVCVCARAFVCESESHKQIKWHFRYIFSEVRQPNPIWMHCICWFVGYFFFVAQMICVLSFRWIVVKCAMAQRRVKWSGKLSYNFSNHNAKITFTHVERDVLNSKPIMILFAFDWNNRLQRDLATDWDLCLATFITFAFFC